MRLVDFFRRSVKVNQPMVPLEDELELLDSILNFTDIELAQIVRGRDESKN